jgi:outer membrane protein assembly factor BamB/ABC-type phosphate/phosphonate transport system substrate-binding protein
MERITLKWRAYALAAAAASLLSTVVQAAPESPPSDGALSMIVMDPLALPLSCPCVAGYAQRKYEVLGEYLTERLGRPVVITYAESIKNALDKESVDDVHIVIGKDSVVRSQGKELKLDVSLLARLVGKDGKTTQTGLVVVRAADPAQTISDLTGYRILFGPPSCDEKFAAARKLFDEVGIALPAEKDSEITGACSDGACMIIDWGDKIRGAAVISSYAAPLLEGCGTIKKGDLRVVGETAPVPFVAAFATNRLNEAEQAELQKALYEAARSPGMLIALETLLGFVPEDFKPIEIPKPTAKTNVEPPVEKPKAAATDSAAPKTTQAWPGWLGPERNGRVGWLPHVLPEEPQIVWRRPLARSGMGGLAATDQFVFVGDRDAANRADVFRCLDAATGDELWTVTYPTLGQLDYDNAPRATPLIHDGRVYFFGAFGDLTCADIQTGAVIWRTNIRLKFLALDQLQWGTCSSPLVVDDLIIVNPGAPGASLAALEADTGDIRWQTPGEPQGHGSFIVATLSAVRQIVGHTQVELGGWDPATGRKLWSLTAPIRGDFNVPTPVVVGDKLLVATENNGGRLYAFNNDGRIVPDPIAVNMRLNPQMSTPVVVGNRVFCVNSGVECFDLERGLAPMWRAKDRAFTEFGAMLASDDRLLVQGRGGELILFDFQSDVPRILSRMPIAADEVTRSAELFTFPALVGTNLYQRCERELVCVELVPGRGH